MTEIELEYAKQKYKIALEGKKNLLECLNKYSVQQFVENVETLSYKKIVTITEDMILRNAFLSVFQNTKESSNLMVYINQIERINAIINDEQPELIGANWKQPKIKIPDKLHTYNLYCDLETNHPILIDYKKHEEFQEENKTICLPDYNREEPETYRYSSHSLEKITKGSQTEAFNRLQLYYFRQLLESSREEALTRMKSLTQQDYRKICLK